MRKIILLIAATSLLGACVGLKNGPSAQQEFENGLALFNVGKCEQAIPRFEKAAQMDPDFAKAYIYLGRSYLCERRWLDAISPLRTALRLSPAETRQEAMDILLDALLAAARDQFNKGNFQSSVDYLEEGLKLEPQSDQFMSELLITLTAFGDRLLSQAQFSEAIATFKEVIQLSPDYLQGYLGLARAFWREGEWVEALQAVQRAATISPTHPEVESLLRELVKPK
jgi:tetratricopeptide (TPR) repeat protein